MTEYLRSRAVVVWVGLIVATAVSWWVGNEHGLTGDLGRRITFGLVLLVAYIKIWFVGLDFMELRAAPRGLRMAFEGWLGLFAVATLVLVMV